MTSSTNVTNLGRMYYVYGAYASNGELLYIGQTGYVPARARVHRYGGKIRQWIKANNGATVEFRTLYTFDRQEQAKTMEVLSIAHHKPPLNSTCKGRGYRSKFLAKPRRVHSKIS